MVENISHLCESCWNFASLTHNPEVGHSNEKYRTPTDSHKTDSKDFPHLFSAMLLRTNSMNFRERRIFWSTAHSRSIASNGILWSIRCTYGHQAYAEMGILVWHVLILNQILSNYFTLKSINNNFTPAKLKALIRQSRFCLKTKLEFLKFALVCLAKGPKNPKYWACLIATAYNFQIPVHATQVG